MPQVSPLVSFDTSPELRPAWETLAAGVPFRSFAWLSTWWKHYGAGHELATLLVHDSSGRLIGAAPWYLETSATEGRTLRFLGTGEVCSDYLSILCLPDAEEAVAAALAEYLCGPDAPEWDLIHLQGVDHEDTVVARLAAQLATRNCGVHHQEAFRCWRIELPASWDEFLAIQSKCHRKQLRRAEKRFLANTQAAVHLCLEENFDQCWSVLVDLHQRRRQSLGEPGCFSSPRFAHFHRDVAEQLLAQNMLRLTWLELDGQPAAVDYDLMGEGITYAYQSGIAPELLDHEPGRLIMITMIRQAIDAGQHGFDFLRGDESYKAHWRAEPRPAFDWRIVADTPRARLRHGVWRAAGSMKEWLKSTRSLVTGGEA